MIKRLATVLSTLFIFLAFGAASAQTTNTTTTSYSEKSSTSEDWQLRPGLSVGGRAAYYNSADTNAVKRDWYGGAQVRLHLTPWVAVEGSADYRQEHFLNPDVTADVFPVQASLLLYLMPTARISPFVLGGAGWYFTHTHGPNDFNENRHRFGGHAGAGLQFFLSRHWSIDGTGRYAWIENVKSTSTSNVVDKQFNGNGWQITAGLNFHF